MAFTANTFVLCSRFELFKAHANLWIYITPDTLDDVLVPHYFKPRHNLANHDSPNVGDIIQCFLENNKLAYLRIVAKTERPYYITVERTYLESEERIFAEIAKRAIKATDFVSPITDDNKGITQVEQEILNQKIDTAATSGTMLTAQGLWYAKMYSATTAPVPTIAGSNYGDFSNTDGSVSIYTATESDAGTLEWALTTTLTPPTDKDGYVPITSKFWDITEQDGQQGGRVMWNHQSTQWTPYPTIVSFENAHLTGISTTALDVTRNNIASNEIASVGFVNRYRNVQSVGHPDITTISDEYHVAIDDTDDIYYIDLTNNYDKNVIFDTADLDDTITDQYSVRTIEIHIKVGDTIPAVSFPDVTTELTESATTVQYANKTSIFVIRVQKFGNNVTQILNYAGSYDDTISA